MSIKQIRLFGDPILTTRAQEVTSFDKELRNLIKDLEDTMLDAPGVGLAAPQLGVSLRVFTYVVDSDEPGHLVNPVLDLSEEIQKTTQSKTMELLQGMQIPDDIKNLSDGGEEGGEGGTGTPPAA